MAATQRHESFVVLVCYPGKDPNSKSEVRSLVNASRFDTAIQSEIVSAVILSQGPAVFHRALMPTHEVAEAGDSGRRPPLWENQGCMEIIVAQTA